MSAANVNTATGTTVTAEARVPYVGRFAPSPTGPLHLGSLATAAASFLDARRQRGSWLLRIEDLDAERTVPGAADRILRTLEHLGFEWQGPVVHQSQRTGLYEQALADLSTRGLIYPCSCTRRDRGSTDDTGGYPGTCRVGPTKPGPHALRFRSDRVATTPFLDRVQGYRPAAQGAQGDPIVRRRDGTFAYQLAVVVDDAAQAVTDIVRGADLLSSTPWQRALQQALGLAEPRYAHLPLICAPDGRKLAKSAHAIAPAESAPAALVWQVLQLLRQTPPTELATAPLTELWTWAEEHWRPERLAGIERLPAS